MAVVRPTLTYECVRLGRTKTIKMEEKSVSFKNNTLRLICGVKRENALNFRCRRINPRDYRNT